MTTFLIGLAIGATYGAVGVAAVVVARVTRTLHLAVGPILVAGVLTTLTATGLGAPRAAATLAGVGVGALAAALLEPLVLRPLSSRPFAPVRDGPPPVIRWLVGLAVAAAVVETAASRWLATGRFRPEPLVLGEGVLVVFGVPVGEETLVALVGGLGLATILGLVVGHTRWGRRLRVVGSSAEAAALGGIRPSLTRLQALAVSGAVAVVAGLLLAPVTPVGIGQAAGLTVRGVAAATVLGFAGGPGRAVLAGLLLGLTEAGAQAAWPGVGGDLVIGVVVVGLLLIRGPERRRAWGRAW